MLSLPSLGICSWHGLGARFPLPRWYRNELIVLGRWNSLQKPWRSFDERYQGLIPPNLHPLGIPAAHAEIGGRSRLPPHFWGGKVPNASNLEEKPTQRGFAFLAAIHQSSQLQARLPSRASPLLSTAPNTPHICRLARTCAPSHRSRANRGQSSLYLGNICFFDRLARDHASPPCWAEPCQLHPASDPDQVVT